MLPFALIFGAIGLVTSAIGSFQAAAGAERQAAASERAERLREQQMKLESARQRRQSIRTMLQARSQALLAAQAKGGATGSGIAGGIGQITSQTASNVQGINNAEEIGSGIFRENREIASAGAQVAWGQALTSLGRDISNIRIG